MTRTIALSEEVYRKLKQLKDSLGVGYSDLIDMLIEAYRRYRVEELKRLCTELRVSDEEAKRITEVLKGLRERRWW